MSLNPVLRNGAKATPASSQPSLSRPGRSSQADKAAIVLMALDDERSQRILSQLSEDEIRHLGIAMSRLGRPNIETVERTVAEFQAEVGRTFGKIGDPAATEKLLRRFLPLDKVAEIMDGIKGPSQGNIWQTLSQMPPQTLSGYLRNEYPQTSAVILANLPPSQAAKVLKLLPDEMSGDVALRLVRISSIQKSILTDIEETLRREFSGELTRSSERDGASLLAEMLNRSVPEVAERILAAIEDVEPQTAAWVRRMMFTFEDLQRIDPTTIGALIAECSVDWIPIALANASPAVRELFLSRMSDRARGMLMEEMENMPLPRRKAIDQAQAEIMALAKRLFDEGRLQLLGPEEDDAEGEYYNTWSAPSGSPG